MVIYDESPYSFAMMNVYSQFSLSCWSWSHELFRQSWPDILYHEKLHIIS